MTPLSAEALTATLALVGIVILISALLSGLVERSRLPQGWLQARILIGGWEAWQKASLPVEPKTEHTDA